MKKCNFCAIFGQVLLCAVAWTQATTGDPFVGTFSGSGLTLTLTGQNGRYSGSAVFEGQTLPVSAQKIGDGILSGSYTMEGQQLPFQAQVQGNTLTLSGGGEVYILTRQAGSQSSAGGAVPSGSTKNDEWGMRFATPTGWTARLTESGYLLGSKTVKGILLLLPNEATSLEEIRSSAQEGIVETGVQLRLAGEITPFGETGLAAYYEGTLQGKQAKAYAIGLLSPHGVGAIIMVMVEPQSYTPEHTKAVEALASSIVFYEPPIPPIALEWKHKLSGCRLSYYSSYSSGSFGGYTSKTTIDLCAQGFFRYGLNDETVWNAGTHTLTGGYVMKYGKGSGTWSVVARNGEPVLQLNYYDGKVVSYELSNDKKGRTYLDGSRYLRTCDPNDQVVEARPNCR